MNHSPSNKSGHIHVNGPRGLSPIALLLLTSIYVLAFVDRQIVNILAEQIKEDLSLSDWQVGILAGPAFAIPYMLATLPMARLISGTMLVINDGSPFNLRYSSGF